MNNSFRYETHCHSSQSSGCAHVDSRDVVKFYAEKGYTGLWFTDHFVVNRNDGLTWSERVEKLCLGYNEAKKTAEECGIDLFMGWEFTNGPEAGTDYLTYGLPVTWLLEHSEIDTIGSRKYLGLAREAGALVIQAHPYRQARYIDMIRLLPDCINGAEVLNSNRTDFENARAEEYVQAYGLMPFAGTDNHLGASQKRLCGVDLQEKALSASHWCDIIRSGKYSLFDERND